MTFLLESPICCKGKRGRESHSVSPNQDTPATPEAKRGEALDVLTAAIAIRSLSHSELIFKKAEEYSSLSKRECLKICQYIDENRLKHSIAASFLPDETVYLREKLPRPIQFNADGHVYIHLTKQKEGDFIAGSGTFKRVRIALDYDLIKEVAVARTVIEDDEDLESCINEKKMQLLLRDQIGIVQSIEDVVVVGKGDAKKYFSLQEFYSGGNLEDFIIDAVELGDDLSVSLNDITRDLLFAFKALEEKSIIHRDIKPANIMMKGGRAFLGDFGLACLINDYKELKIWVGTSDFLSPEYCREVLKINFDESLNLDISFVTSKMDSWALGCSLFKLYTKAELPWVEGLIEERRIIRSCAWLTQSDIPEILVDDPIINKLLRGLLQVDPRKRFSATQAFEFISKI